MPTYPCITSLIINEPKILIFSTRNVCRNQYDLSKSLFHSMACRSHTKVPCTPAYTTFVAPQCCPPLMTRRSNRTSSTRSVLLFAYGLNASITNHHRKHCRTITAKIAISPSLQVLNLCCNCNTYASTIPMRSPYRYDCSTIKTHLGKGLFIA